MVRLRFDVPPAEDSQAEDLDRDTAVAGLRCRIVGAEQPLATDLAAYLRSAGASVDPSDDLVAAAAADAAPGLCLWLVLPGQVQLDLADLRALAPARNGSETRFVVLGSGERRHPRVQAADLFEVDADVLCRRTLFRLLALAAGRSLPSTAAGTPGRAGADPATAPRPPTVARPVGGPRGPVLIAEDNETNRKVIVLQLQLIGVETEVVVDGREALQRWRGGDYALLLTDLHMPELDGYALARAIRAEEPAGRHLPIIALTANALPDEEQRCRDAGMDAFLTKPVRLARLKEVIEQWLGRDASSLPAPAPREPAGEAALDLGTLAALVGDDAAVIDEVLQAFREGSAPSGESLVSALRTGAVGTALEAAHKLKSGARSIGALRLAEVCAEVQALNEAGAPARADALAALGSRFEAELARVFASIDERLAPAGPGLPIAVSPSRMTAAASARRHTAAPPGDRSP